MKISGTIQSSIPVFVISIKSDIERRAELRRQFGDVYDTFTIVDGVELHDYEATPRRFRPRVWRDSRQAELARRQIGCALSHMRVLERFLDTKAERCVVFEDDVLGGADDLCRAEALLDLLPLDAIVILGGQDGLLGRRHLAGVKLPSVDAWRIPPISRYFLARAVCYALTRSSAYFLLTRQRMCLDHPDHWGALLRGYRSVFYAEIFRHPLDLRQSHMESARKAAKSRSAILRVVEDGAWETALRNVSKICIPVFRPFFGVSRIPFKAN